MKKEISIQVKDYNIELITNGAEEFDKIVLCFHGFNGDKWGDAYSGLKRRLENTLVCSFDSCGHGKSVVLSENMRLDLVLQEIEAVISFLKSKCSNKQIILVAVSYGAYRVMNYLIKYKPQIEKVIYINPAFKMLNTLEILKDFKYADLKAEDRVVMKRSLNKFISKDFLDDLYENNLYSKTFDIKCNTQIIVGTRDSLIPIADTLELAEKYNYKITYVDDEHCFENIESWNAVVDSIKE